MTERSSNVAASRKVADRMPTGCLFEAGADPEIPI